MKTLLATLYGKYETTLDEQFQKASPAATSRFELVYDDMSLVAQVHSPVSRFGNFSLSNPGYTLLGQFRNR
jgi:hypothetical protein